jgi:hypothetical protein
VALISAIFILDELPHLSCVPWKAAFNSALRFSDEVIVVHGGKTDRNGCRAALDYIENLNDSRIKTLIFDWPESFDWTQLARSCTFGQLHAAGEWAFRILIDEVFPDNFISVRKMLQSLPSHVAVASVGRYYLLGNRFAFPYREKPLFIRQGSGYGYGIINYEQSAEAMPCMFDDPVDLRRWYETGEVKQVQGPTILESEDAIQKLMNGYVPKGYRDVSGKHQCRLQLAFLNTDVNFMPDELIVDQKYRSSLGYLRLPPSYRKELYAPGTDILESVRLKIERMLASGNLVEVDPPEDLMIYTDDHDDVQNVVRRLCEEEYGLPWNRVSTHISWRGRVRRTLRGVRKTISHFMEGI